MRVLIVFLLCSFFCFRLFGAELSLSGGASFHQMNIYGSGDVPTYRGSGYFAEAEYQINVSWAFSLSPFIVYHSSSQKNTFDTSSIKENAEGTYFGFGLKVWFDETFISASYGSLDLELTATGTVNRSISGKDSAYEFGLGHRFRLTNYLSLIVSLNALGAKLDPNNGTGFSRELEVWSYRGSLGLNMILPSFAW